MLCRVPPAVPGCGLRWRVLWRAPRLFVIHATALVVVHATPVDAQDRLVRQFGAENGLPAAPVAALAQDSTGFLWVGSTGGLIRFDGIEFRRWAPDQIRGGVMSVAVSPSGVVTALGATGALHEVTSTGTREIPLPEGRSSLFYPRAAFDSTGALWITDRSGVMRRDADGSWRVLDPGAFADEEPWWVRPEKGGGVVIVTRAGAWRVAPDGLATKLFTAPDVVDVLSADRGRLLVLTGGGLYELGSELTRQLLDFSTLPRARAISLAERRGTIWIGFGYQLVALRPGAPPEVLGLGDGIRGLGPLLVDHEESLWLGSQDGLLQLPEPETQVWTERKGLPSRSTRFVSRAGEVLWVSSWGGTAYLKPAAPHLNATPRPRADSQGPLCLAESGRLWLTTVNGELVEVADTSELRRHTGFNARIHDCAVTRGAGEIWLATSAGLRHVDPRTFASRDVKTPFQPPAIDATLHTRDGWLWVGQQNRLCRTNAALVAGTDEPEWSCNDVPGGLHVQRLAELPSGAVWASVADVGILRFAEGQWQRLGGSDALATLTVHDIVPSRDGGIWLVGHGVAARVEERADNDSGWDVLEALSFWHGLTVVGGSDLFEEEEGSLWIPTSQGLLHVPASARFSSPSAPHVILVEARAGERMLPLDASIALPHRQNNVELRFAALSYRDPTLLRYQVRIAPDADWTDVRGTPAFRWTELRAGRHDAEVRASLDGIQWSAVPARLTFDVRPPWYYAPPALTFFTIMASLLLWGLYRLRLAYLVGLERQRTRIAMDLHDEVGSALGSISILSGVLARDTLRGDERHRVASQVACTAEELGGALSDIVWSLQPGAATLQDLASRLADHGARLFPGDEFTADLPRSWPTAALPLTVLRNVLLIGMEALYNAARHSNANQVVLRLTTRGPAWELTVQDDGRGMAGAQCDRNHGGQGLLGMQRRATEIGAVLDIASDTECGTNVRLRFQPRQPGWWRNPRLRGMRAAGSRRKQT